MKERLLEIMQALKLDDAALAAAIGLRATYFRRYLRDEGDQYSIGPENLAPKLVKIGISSDWFLTGKGPMMLKDVSPRTEDERRRERIGELMEGVFRELLEGSQLTTRHDTTRHDTVKDAPPGPAPDYSDVQRQSQLFK